LARARPYGRQREARMPRTDEEIAEIVRREAQRMTQKDRPCPRLPLTKEETRRMAQLLESSLGDGDSR
jgi:hypothetical protein